MIISSKVKLDFEFIDPCLGQAWVATAVIGSAVIGAGAQMFGASKAADVQSKNAERTAQIQQQQYAQTREDLSPYRQIGQDASGRLTNRLSELTTPISVDPNVLNQSDYYKFASTQGQKAVQNSAAARGLGSSGAALKGAATFAKGLATDTYKTSFDMANINQTNAYSRLKALVDTGQSASAQTGSYGQSAAQAAGAALTGGANAEAASYNAMGKSIADLSGKIGGYSMYQGLYGNKG